MRAGLAALGLALLAGCASLPPAPPPPDDPAVHASLWLRHQAHTEALERFAIEARAAGTGLAGAKADVHYRQDSDDHFRMRVAGPFGAGALSLAGNAQAVEVQSREGRTLTEDPQGWLYERSGWSLPLSHLRWWLRGLPAPTTAQRLEFDADGYLTLLEQDGWLLNYADYQPVAQWVLPRRLEARQGERRMRILIDRWDPAPDSGP